MTNDIILLKLNCHSLCYGVYHSTMCYIITQFSYQFIYYKHYESVVQCVVMLFTLHLVHND